MTLPTQRDLALRLGLSQACVSKALQGRRGIAASTRERVLSAAAELGYRPDPVLSALVHRGRGKTPPKGAIAYIRHYVTGDEYAEDPYYVFVADRCSQLGLTLWLLDRDQDDAMVQRWLDQRRLAGVFIGHTRTGEFPRLAWGKLRAVHCGLVVPPETGDIVCADLTWAVPTAWKAMTARGYDRIAAVFFTDDPRAHSQRMLSGSLLALEREVGEERRLASWIGPMERQAEAVAWVRQHRPQAVLYNHAYVAHGLRFDIGLPFAVAATDSWGLEIAGMAIPFADVAAAAVDLMLQRMRSEPGPLRGRRTHLIEMEWRDGTSLPRRA